MLIPHSSPPAIFETPLLRVFANTTVFVKDLKFDRRVSASPTPGNSISTSSQRAHRGLTQDCYLFHISTRSTIPQTTLSGKLRIRRGTQSGSRNGIVFDSLRKERSQ